VDDVAQGLEDATRNVLWKQGGVGAYACDGGDAGWRQIGDLASCLRAIPYRWLHGS
jgi:hypothetical protein